MEIEIEDIECCSDDILDMLEHYDVQMTDYQMFKIERDLPEHIRIHMEEIKELVETEIEKEYENTIKDLEMEISKLKKQSLLVLS